MKERDVLSRAFAMPLTSPAFPIGPYRFVNREFLVITYRTDPQKLRELVPEPLQIDEPLVKFEFIRMPDSTGFGDYTESGQVIPVSFDGRKGGYSHCMFLDDHPPIAGGRELWGFPKKLANPILRAEIDTLVGELHYGQIRIAVGTMGYKHKEADLAAVWNAPTTTPRELLAPGNGNGPPSTTSSILMGLSLMLVIQIVRMHSRKVASFPRILAAASCGVFCAIASCSGSLISPQSPDEQIIALWSILSEIPYRFMRSGSG